MESLIADYSHDIYGRKQNYVTIFCDLQKVSDKEKE